ncbi:hypothetical protein CEW89_09575 [Celeribacter ethanolicus]|uniref:Uncharacterized protein n=1 Tax=Celeribacter ethanolicus TaxID=1758178 RepID=A0A291GCL2_9RHOB|nr:hypothetical protein [Celeribacter ethanolicus]ATG47790.1 hypothetical protein CEW89_09575 [Celeribacter ethanolicus]
MDIEWEDQDRAPSSMGSKFLTLVERPDAKGGLFWEHEYGKLLKQVQVHRAVTDGAMQRAFRDRSEERVDVAKLRVALAQEKAGIKALLDFLDADEAGNHH